MMWCPDCSKIAALLIILHTLFEPSNTAKVKDIFNLDTNKLVRVSREEKLYHDRYGSNVASESVLNTRAIKPEDTLDNRDPTTTLGKRCIRCEIGRYPAYDPYDYKRGYDDRDRGSNRDRYDDRYDDTRYDQYYRDRNYDRRYDPYDRYEKYDRYDRYDQRRDYYDRDRDYYGRDRYRDRYIDRGIGYDNRGYDYRDNWNGGYRDRDRDYYRPSYYDDRNDLNSRGYGERPYDYGSSWGGGYASSWNYVGGRDDYRDRYGDDRYRYKDVYDAYRPTSYLYGRPSTTIPNTTPKSNDHTDSTELPVNNSS